MSVWTQGKVAVAFCTANGDPNKLVCSFSCFSLHILHAKLETPPLPLAQPRFPPLSPPNKVFLGFLKLYTAEGLRHLMLGRIEDVK